MWDLNNVSLFKLDFILKCRLFELLPPCIKLYLHDEVIHMKDHLNMDIKLKKVTDCYVTGTREGSEPRNFHASKLDKLEANEIVEISRNLIIQTALIGTVCNLGGFCSFNNNNLNIWRSELTLDEFRMLLSDGSKEFNHLELLDNKICDTRPNSSVELCETQLLKYYLNMGKKSSRAHFGFRGILENWEKILYDTDQIRIKHLKLSFYLSESYYRNLFTNVEYLYSFLERQVGLTLSIQTTAVNIKFLDKLLDFFEKSDKYDYRIVVFTYYYNDWSFFKLRNVM